MKKPGTLLSMFAALLLFSVGATAQTYSNLFTYPGTDNNTSGITWPSVPLGAGRNGPRLRTSANAGGTLYAATIRRASPSQR